MWANEGVEIAEDTNTTFGKLNFTARTLRCLVTASRELLEDSINLSQKLPDVFARIMAPKSIAWHCSASMLRRATATSRSASRTMPTSTRFDGR